MPKITINGKQLEVAAGTTVIQAFKASGQDICHYCWHPGLSVAGVCRLCMVQIEGQPKLQIACNTEVRDGMVVNNTSDAVKDTVKWGLDFHLINHPLDCPICDQAGECGLQDQYMRFGAYDPEMAEKKVKKHKVVDLGPTIVLDTERCILCSRCVRFTEEVSGTRELGIYNRGDHSEIGTFEGRPLDNNYSLNTVDICPVGALTSKDFRFRQRAWYLKQADSICPGCSTGCNVQVSYNEEGLWRVKPRENPDVNKYWMCDVGRNTYKFVNLKTRLLGGRTGAGGSWRETIVDDTVAGAAAAIRSSVESHGTGAVGLVLTGQYTNEEYRDLLAHFKEAGVTQVYHWQNKPENVDAFDGLLFRGDENPNTRGLLAALGGKPGRWDELVAKLGSGALKTLVVAGPENQATFPDLAEKVALFSKVENLVWMGAGEVAGLEGSTGNVWLIPLKTYIEKAGSFTNHAGLVQKFRVGTTIVPQALTLSEVADLMGGRALDWSMRGHRVGGAKRNYALNHPGSL